MSFQENSADLIKPLSALNPEDKGRVGNKAWNLSRLIALGLPVPKGLVLPVSTVEKLLEGNLSAQENESVLEAIRQLGSKTVAVRSSGLVEDSLEG